jgi:HlyD family secretion protein
MTAMPTRRALPVLLAALPALAACDGDEPDAYGNFEATEVVVAAEASGQLLRFALEEGARLAAGDTVGLIDTTALALERGELLARRQAARSRAGEVAAQTDVLEAQREVAAREYERARRLLASQAATAQQLDRAEREYRTLGEQIEATRAQRATRRDEIASIEAQIALVDQRLRESRIVNPAAGAVLATYAEPGEVVQAGQPLYRIAPLDTMTLRAYVSGAQLSSVRIGQTVRVRIDAAGGGLRTLPGRVSWIAAEAEFTPTPIQTRDERTEQVYAMKVRVPNPDGALKIGMPAEVVLGAGAEPEERP